MATKKEKAAVKEGQSQKIVERVPGAWDLENKHIAERLIKIDVLV